MGEVADAAAATKTSREAAGPMVEVLILSGEGQLRAE